MISVKPYILQLSTIVRLRLVRTDSVKTFPGDLSVHAGRVYRKTMWKWCVYHRATSGDMNYKTVITI